MWLSVQPFVWVFGYVYMILYIFRVIDEFFGILLFSVEQTVRQQTNTWAYVMPHLCHHMTSLGDSVLTLVLPQHYSKPSMYYCSGSAGASVVAHGVALPLYRDCFLDLRLFNSPDLRRLVLCYCCQAWTLETVLGGNTALPRWWTARSIDADAKR